MPVRSHLAASAHCCSPLWARRSHQPWPAHHLLVAAAVPARLGFLGVGGFSVPPQPPSVLPRHSIYLGGWVLGDFLSPPSPHLSSLDTPSTLGVTPDFSSPRGNSFTMGVSMTLGELTPPRIPWQSLLGFSATTEALGTPSLLPIPENSPARFYRRPETLSLSSYFSPWRPPTPAFSVAGGDIPGVAPAGCCTPW